MQLFAWSGEDDAGSEKRQSYANRSSGSLSRDGSVGLVAGCKGCIELSGSRSGACGQSVIASHILHTNNHEYGGSCLSMCYMRQAT